MRYVGSLVSALAVLLTPVTQVQAQEGKVYKPSSVWALEYGDDYCRLMRDFTDGTDTVGLFIERTQPGAMMRVALVGNSIRLFRGADEIGYRMAPSGAQRTTPRVVSAVADGDQYLNLGQTTFADMPAPSRNGPPQMPPPYTREAEVEAAKKVTGIALTQGVTTPVLIDTGDMGDAAGALQACADDLVASWGLDAEKHKALSRPATPSSPASAWVPADTIGFQDFAKLSGGNNEFRVMVDAAGKPTSCHILWPTLGEATNKKICDSLMAKGSFTPALDQNGQAIASYWAANAFAFMAPMRRR